MSQPARVTTRVVSREVIDAVRAVVAHSLPSETSDYLRQNPADRDQRIYGALTTLNTWLEQLGTHREGGEIGHDPRWSDAAETFNAGFDFLTGVDRTLLELAQDPSNDCEEIQFQRGKFNAGLGILREVADAVEAETHLMSQVNNGPARANLTFVWDRAPGEPLPPGADVDEYRLDLLADGTSIGYASVIDCGRYVWIEYIQVEPQRHGHGTRLLTAVLDAFPGRTFALSADEPLVPWYSTFGFQPGHVGYQDCLVCSPEHDDDERAATDFDVALCATRGGDA